MGENEPVLDYEDMTPMQRQLVKRAVEIGLHVEYIDNWRQNRTRYPSLLIYNSDHEPVAELRAGADGIRKAHRTLTYYWIDGKSEAGEYRKIQMTKAWVEAFLSIEEGKQ